MRILYLNHNPAGVGTWQRASNFGRALARRGHEVTLVTTHPSRRFGFESAREGSYTELRAPDLFSGPARTGWDPSNALRRLLKLRGHDFDLVHAFDARPTVIAPALDVVRRTGAALFLDWADWWGRGGRIEERSGWLVRTFFGPVETWFEEAFRTRADGTTTISEALAQRAVRLGVDPSTLWVLPNGCDAALELPHQREARAQLGVDPDAPIVLHAGVLTVADMAQLAGAIRLLVGEVPEARLILAGNPKVPVPEDTLANGSIRPVGFLPRAELHLWLAAADVCVVPLVDTLNNQGRWPGRLNDYFAAGRPTVMPRVGDAALLLERVRAGWTCEPSAEGLAEALIAALRDPETRRSAGQNALALAKGPLAWSVLAERLEAAYFSTLNRTLARAAEKRSVAGVRG